MYHTTIGYRQYNLESGHLRERIERLSAVESQREGILDIDLRLKSGNILSQAFWHLARHDYFCKRFFFNNDHNQSRRVLLYLAGSRNFDHLDLPGAIAGFNIIAPNHSIRLKSTSEYVNEYLAMWDTTNQSFGEFSFSDLEFNYLLRTYRKQFPVRFDYTESYGIVRKKVFDSNQNKKIFVRADLHGDLLSLLTCLEGLVQQGILTKEYKCADDVELVFLGDFADRGPYVMQVLQILITLKLENPQVTLIRGNHEYLQQNIKESRAGGQSDDFFVSYLESNTNLEALDSFYKSLPLAFFLGIRDETGKCEFGVFSHGAIELEFDPSPMLDSDEFNQMIVPKRLKSVSQRIKDIPPVDCDIFNQGSSKAERRQLKRQIAAMRLRHLVGINGRRYRADKITCFNWGDVKNETSLGNLGERKWCLSAEDIKHCMRLFSDRHAVRVLVRGHQHVDKRELVGDRVVVRTLPIGADYKKFDDFGQKPKDVSLIISTAPKVKDWKCVTMTRVSGELNIAFSDEQPL